MTITVTNTSSSVIEKKVSSDGNENPAFVNSSSFRSSLRLNMFDIELNQPSRPIRNQFSLNLISDRISNRVQFSRQVEMTLPSFDTPLLNWLFSVKKNTFNFTFVPTRVWVTREFSSERGDMFNLAYIAATILNFGLAWMCTLNIKFFKIVVTM